jgi:hypothetical protein
MRTGEVEEILPAEQGTEPMRTNPMNSNVARAVGVALREHYTGTLKEDIPAPLMDLLVRLSQRSSPASEVASRAKGLPPPLSTVAAKYDRAIEKAAQCVVTVARTDQFATAGQAWMLKALQLRGGLADGDVVDRAVLRTVLEDVVELAIAKSIEELLPNAGGHSGEAPDVEAHLADGLRQNLRRIAERFPVAH